MDTINAMRSVYGMEGLKCRRCGQRAYLDVIVYPFRGCQDEMWICDRCNVLFHVKVRYGRVISVRGNDTD